MADNERRNARSGWIILEKERCTNPIISSPRPVRKTNVIPKAQPTASNAMLKQSLLEIDFIVNKGYQRYYIQSALNVDTKEKRNQETNSLIRVDDSFQKIVVLKEDIIPWTDESGIQYVCIQEFLLSFIEKI